MELIQLRGTDLALAASLVVISALLSQLLSLGLTRGIAWAACRTVVQLLLVGMVLSFVFTHASPWLTSLIVLVMMCLAILEVTVRPRVRLLANGNVWVAAMAVSAATFVTVAFILSTALRPDPWYDPRYVIALVGIVLGSVLNAASICMDSMLSGVRHDQAAIEARLALGDSPRIAFSALIAVSVRRGVLPSINQMSAAGIITLPGIMTGQIIAGMDPLNAVKYQILVMFLLCGASTLASICSAYAILRRVTDDRARLRLDRLTF